MSEHTPGDWAVGEMHAQMIDIVHFNNAPGAMSFVLAKVTARPTWLKEAEANARLISAAPDLLKKAQAVIEWWDAFVQTTKHDTQPECEDAEFSEFNQLRAAIAKATAP